MSYATAYASHDSLVANEANAYFWLLKARLATLSLHDNINECVNSGVTGYLFGQIMHFRALEANYRTAFDAYASDDLKAIFDKYMNANNTKDNVIGMYWKAFDSYQLIVQEGPTKKLDLGASWNNISSSTKSAYEHASNDVLNVLMDLGEQKVSSSATSLITVSILMVIIIIVVLGIATTVISSIARSLKDSQETMQELADTKNMSLKLDDSQNNELSKMAKSFNNLIKAFNHALVLVHKQVVLASQSVETGVEKMTVTEQACDDQQSSTDTISAAMHEMSTNIGEVSKVAQDAADGVKVAHNLSLDSEQNWNQCRDSLENLTVGLKSASDSVLELNRETERIVGILDIIQGIAEQTNLLALNAAIEAARAGESGKGFAVVADEVRNLAMKSKDSTQQIRAQIDKLVQGANAANQSMEILQKDGKTSVDMVVTAADSFTQIREELDKITDLTNVLASSAEEQASVSTHITERVVSIKDASTAIQASATDTIGTLHQLAGEFQTLENVVAQFKVEQ